MFDLFSEFFNDFDVFSVYQDVNVCPKCGRSYRDFQKSGKFGCAGCYETFRAPVSATLKQIHQNNAHTGKIPSKSAAQLKQQRHLEDLKKQLAQAVSAEQYEEAARLHKEIKALGDIEK